MNASFTQGAVTYTVRSWLNSNALGVDPRHYRATADAIERIDWNSSDTSTPANIAGVHVPLLIMAMTGHHWLVPSEIFYQQAAGADKELVFVDGQYGDMVKTTFDHVASWLRKRFAHTE